MVSTMEIGFTIRVYYYTVHFLWARIKKTQIPSPFSYCLDAKGGWVEHDFHTSVVAAMYIVRCWRLRWNRYTHLYFPPIRVCL